MGQKFVVRRSRFRPRQADPNEVMQSDIKDAQLEPRKSTEALAGGISPSFSKFRKKKNDVVMDVDVALFRWMAHGSKPWI